MSTGTRMGFDPLITTEFPATTDEVQAVAASFVVAAGWLAGETIPVEQLTHRVPSGAAREYRASAQALGNGNLAQSIAHCETALETDPDNAMGQNDLGVLYLNQGQTAKAWVRFERATALQPNMTAAHVNTSFALLALGRPGDAEGAARTALQLAPHDHRANLLLGWSLTAGFRYTAEALQSLRFAAREYPEARLAAADVLVHNGSLDAARKEVEEYLASDGVEHRILAEHWLKFLTLE